MNQPPTLLPEQGIELQPPKGVHMLLSNRSGARRSLGDKLGALEDANRAADLAPPAFHTAYVRQVGRAGLLLCSSW